MRLSAERALLAFHWRAGTRAALRATTIGVALVLFAVGMAPEPLPLIVDTTRAVVGPARGDQPQLLVAVLCLALAGASARRVALGATEWMRSLPAGGVAARRATAAAAALGQLAAVLALLAAVALAPTVFHVPLVWAKVATLPLLVASAGAAAVRVERAPARALAAAALLLAVWGTWDGAAAGGLALVAWDRWAGGLAERRRPRWRRIAAPDVVTPVRGRRRSAAAQRRRGLALAARLAWRAGGTRAALDALPAAALPVAFAFFIRRNNGDLAPATAATVARLGAGLGAAALVALLANGLLARRTPWSWPRALPWRAADRVVVDVALLAAPAAVLSAVAGVALGAGAALAGALAALVSAGARGGGAAAGRRAADRRRRRDADRRRAVRRGRRAPPRARRARAGGLRRGVRARRAARPA